MATARPTRNEANIQNEWRSSLLTPDTFNAIYTGDGWTASPANSLASTLLCRAVDFVLLALASYSGAFEAQTPNSVARIWLGDTYVGENIYRGRTSEQHETAIPMDYLAASLPSGVAAVTGRTWSWAKRDPGAFVTAWAFATHRQTLLWSRWTGVLSCSAATKESTAWRM